MRIALFGGTRGVGRQVLVQALEKEWGIKLLARNPGAVPPEAGLQVIGGDAMDPGKVIQTITGCDAVVCCLGPAKGSPRDVCSRWTEIIIPAMQKFSLTRIVVITGMGTGDSLKQIPGWYRWLFRLLLRSSLADKERQEALLRDSGLDWTIIRPGGLTDKPTANPPAIGVDQTTPARMVSREAVAALVVQELESGEYRGRTPYIT